MRSSAIVAGFSSLGMTDDPSHGRCEPSSPAVALRTVKLLKGITPRQLLFDLLLAAVVLAVGLMSTLHLGDVPATPFSREADGFHVLLIVAMSAPLALRRVYPTSVLLVVLASWGIDRGLDYPETSAGFAVAVAFYTIGAELERRRSLQIGGAASAVTVGWAWVGAIVLESVTTVAVVSTLISTVTPLLFGREMHERRRRLTELQVRAERAEHEREEKARQAVSEERSRIARELHDVVAHQMTVMTVQAEGARRVADGADPRLVEALETIRVAGHSALAELRRTVDLLRTPDEESATEPLPRLSDLPRLVERVRAAGVPVELEIRGAPQPLSDGAELSAYRIVQESLTNAVRHGGPGVSAKVSIEYDPDRLDVSVSDDGRGASSQPSPYGGHGIVGMRERIAVLGGEFQAGPKAGGGYLVRASIPLDT